MEDQKVEICWPTPRGHGTEPSLQIQSRQGDIQSTICNHVWLTTISRCYDLLWNGQSLRCFYTSINNLLTASLMQLSLSKSNVQPVLY